MIFPLFDYTLQRQRMLQPDRASEQGAPLTLSNTWKATLTSS